MSEMIRIRRIQDYLEEFGNNGIGKGVPVSIVKEQILDAFRKEIFEQITWKLKIHDISEAQQTHENRKIVENIMKNTYKKWLGVIREFNKYRETLNMLKPEDLQIPEKENVMYDPFDGFDEENEEGARDENAEESYSDDELAGSEETGEVAEDSDDNRPEPEASTDPAGAAVDGESMIFGDTDGDEVVNEPVYAPGTAFPPGYWTHGR